MAMLKTQKIELVKRLAKELKSHKTIAILPTEGLPDRLLQRVRNQLKGKANAAELNPMAAIVTRP